MKKFILIALLATIVITQTTVQPKSQGCECKNLLSQMDCTLKIGCTWTPSNTTIQISDGICSMATQTPPTTIITPTYCSTINIMTQCASIFGCANVDNICTIFTGCQAYAQTTNQACQSISTQCTTDGTKCILPTSCNNYTTEILCKANLATSGAKSCLWSDGKCIDKVCSDAPKILTTKIQCQNWINGCLTSGKGCATTLNPCNTYKRADGCQGMVGSDGNCVDDTSEGSTVCRLAQCSDAQTTLSTNAACADFQAGCLTNGRGCVQSLSPCNSYTSQCQGLIGQDGPCTTDTTEGQTKCRALKCSEAPNSLNTNTACSSFLQGCVTTGYGCDDSLKLCSAYQGTSTTCDSIIGSDGKCRGNSQAIAFCLKRQCSDAPSTINTDQACNLYQNGCITTGAGCTDTLKSCNQYLGTYTQCSQLIGTDGNCTAPQNQVEQGACVAKVCTDAPKTLKTNLDCQNYSKKCIMSSEGCIESVSCPLLSYVACQNNLSCSAQQSCLDRSRCANYSNQSQCSQNKQYYQQGGNSYLRPCVWNETSSCSDTLCNSLPLTLTTDQACSDALPGCLTKGSGCIDISEPCSSYKGLLSCFGFKGLNRTQKCAQISSVSSDQTNCIIKNSCSQAKSMSLGINNNQNCSSFQDSCFFDGKDNCTNGDCASYYGTQTFCGSIKTALSGGVAQDCWKVTDTSVSTSACIPKQCSQSPTTNNSNALCDQFMKGCLWNGTSAGGCQDPSSACTLYKGGQSQCETFSQSGKQCGVGFVACLPTICTQIQVPLSATSNIDKGTYCQQFKNMLGFACQWQSDGSCATPSTFACSSYVAVGADDITKQQYCQTLMYEGGPGCSYAIGDNCSQAKCDDFTAYGFDADAQALYCKSLKINGRGGLCALTNTSGIKCSSTSQCSNYDVKTKEACLTSIFCYWNQMIRKCADRPDNCTDLEIPITITELADKIQYCTSSASLSSVACFYAPVSNRLLQSGDYCTEISNSCTNIVPFQSEMMDKLTYCNSVFVSLAGPVKNCMFSSDQPDRCLNRLQCNTYFVSPTQQQQFCSKLQDTDDFTCSFVQSSNTCNNPQANCSDYFTYGNSVVDNQNFCKQYFASSESAFCGSNTSGPSNCKSQQCSDYTQDDKCQTYIVGCVYNGSVCIDMQSNCSDYVIPNTVQGQQSCFLTQSQSSQCGWTSGTTCSQRQCSQLKTGQSLATCNSFIFCQYRTQDCCQYDGQNCQQQGSCTSYVPNGLTDAAKATVCNNMVGTNGKCTYLGGTTNCVDVKADCTYTKPTSATTNELALSACSLAVDSSGKQCGYTANQPSCSARSCDQSISAKSDSDCKAFLTNCLADLTNQTCSSKLCTNADSTFTTNQSCQQYRGGCVTNGSGCVESTELCSTYKGTQTVCNNFIGNGIPCTNSSTAISTNPCIERTCLLNTTALKDSDCEQWYPSTGNSKNCVWNGSLGCVQPRQCSLFTGTTDTCSKVTATDGPCYRKEANSGACSSTNTGCQNAPSTYNTDILCKSWGSSCITNGLGCIAKATATCASLSQSACPLYKATPGLTCDFAGSCLSKPKNCSEQKNASDCNNVPLVGQDKLTCGWNSQNSTCALLTCDQLPITLTTDAGCSNIFSTCVTNGAGCVTKGACSSYSRQNCGTAVTTDLQKTCIWSNNSCRPIQCQDNTTAQSDSACNSYLQGCKTTGVGCATSLTCSIIKTPQLCQIDSQGLTCLWYKAPNDQVGSCISYSSCTDIIQSTHSACQAASPLCTTNGFTCIAITSCANTILQASCIKGYDGNCGWLPAYQQNPAQCSLYTQCIDAKGTTLQSCQFWGQSCISDGVQCLSKSNCSTYQTQTACVSGTDGQCFWVPQNGQISAFCRLQQCSDATTNYVTHQVCSQFVAQTACTTSGQGCIQLGLCSSYNIKEGCVQGTDGVCFWEQTNDRSQCRLKQCTDVVLATSSACSNAINGVKCVSNSTNCIQKQQCSTYTNREACIGGGLDGNCAFRATNSSIPDIGTCDLFKSCSIADQDQLACNSRSDACFFNSNTTNGTTTSSCPPHTCSSIQQGSQCLAVPSFDLSEYKICVISNNTCIEGNINQFTPQTCYQGSVATYTWSTQTQTCQACVQKNVQINNTDNNTVSNTNGHIVYIIVLIFIMI